MSRTHGFLFWKAFVDGKPAQISRAYLDDLTQRGVMNSLIHRGGLRAQMFNEGVIRVGDAVRPKPSDLRPTIGDLAVYPDHSAAVVENQNRDAAEP